MTVKYDKREVNSLKTEWQIFADEYIISLNATRSYLKAYPDATYNTARTEGCKLLAEPNTKSYIDERMASKQDERIMKQDEILMLLTSIARGEQTEQILQLCGDGCQKLVDKDINAKDRLKALELLGKRYGTFAEKIIVDVDEEKEEALKNLSGMLEQMKNG